MNRWLIALSCTLLFSGCRSAPKSAEVINASNARMLSNLVFEYSTTHGTMPSSIYVLDLSHVKCGDRAARFSDLRCVSSDRKVEADFLYFRASGNFPKVDPDLIVLASPFASTPDERRLVVTASGTTAYLNESQFLDAMTKQKQDSEQFAAPNGP